MQSGVQPMPEQPEILLQLRQKAAELRGVQSRVREEGRELAGAVAVASQELSVLLREKEVQERKSRSLVLLVADLQRQLDDHYSTGPPTPDDEEALVAELALLRELLVKLAERAKEDQKLLSFLRQAANSGPKAEEFVQRSRYLEGQTELLSKLRSQLGSLGNANLECSRKWGELERETLRLRREEGLLRIQGERLKTDLRDHYEDYLETLNRSKAALVTFNETQRERVVTEHLVEEVALLQERRAGVQEQTRNLKHHQEALLEENARIQTENRELNSFFQGSTPQEEQRLALRMRTRIEELRDCLAETERQNAGPQLPVARVAERVRAALKGLEETAAFLEKKIKEEEQGKVALDEKDVVQFFEGVLRGRDERLLVAREREAAAMQRLRELRARRELLASQVDNLKEGMQYHHYENTTLNVTQQPPQYEKSRQPSDQASRWTRKMQDTNLLTTTSKFIPS